MPAIVILAALLIASGSEAQQCRGDLNGSGRTDVSDAITVVNEIITGCGPAQDQCPLDFNDNNSNGSFCHYDGPASSSCIGTFNVSAGWQGNGTVVLAVLVDSTGSIAIAANRTSATTATVAAVSPGPDFNVEVPATGALALPSSSGFNANFNTSARCGDLSFQGTFNDILSPAATRQRQTSSLGSIAALIGGREAQFRETAPAATDIAALLQRFSESRRRMP